MNKGFLTFLTILAQKIVGLYVLHNLFIYVCLFVRSFVRSFVRLFVCLFIYLFITVTRKRQMTINKSQSGGSEADDESVQAAKQPNTKRLSTVSFASTPFVHVSPSVTANSSPVGLSFVSKNSSYKSTDESFTPGGARTVRSSVGSASGSSVVDDSVIDPDEEVTITNDAAQPKGELIQSLFLLVISL